jgi:hypothetical protein
MDTSVAKRSLAEKIGVPVAELENKPLEEVRSLIAGGEETPPAPESAPEGEQRSESVPPSVLRLIAEHNEIK